MILNADTLLALFGFVDYASLVLLQLSAQRFLQVVQSNHKGLACQQILRATFGSETTA